MACARLLAASSPPAGGRGGAVIGPLQGGRGGKQGPWRPTIERMWAQVLGSGWCARAICWFLPHPS